MSQAKTLTLIASDLEIGTSTLIVRSGYRAIVGVPGQTEIRLFGFDLQEQHSLSRGNASTRNRRSFKRAKIVVIQADLRSSIYNFRLRDAGRSWPKSDRISYVWWLT